MHYLGLLYILRGLPSHAEISVPLRFDCEQGDYFPKEQSFEVDSSWCLIFVKKLRLNVGMKAEYGDLVKELQGAKD